MNIKPVMEKVKKSTVSFFCSVPAVLLAVSIVMIIISVICSVSLLRARTERNTASVWSQGSDVSYRHIAVYAQGGRNGGSSSPAAYLEYGKSLSKTDVYNIRKSLQGTVDLSNGTRRRSADRIEDPEGWAECFCSFVNASMTCKHQGFEISSDADVYAVGGNWRVFHPMEFMAGGFLPVKSVDRYQVVLNDSLAWKFFSSYDVIGETVNLWGKDYTVIGVVKEHDDLSLRAYVYFECLEEYCNSFENKIDPSVLCYEAMMPEQVKGASVQDVRNSIPGYDISSPKFYLVSVTDRFTVTNVVKHMLPPGEMSSFLSSYELPFWEISAQKTITWLFVWIVVFAVSLLIALLQIGWFVFRNRK